MTEGRDIRSGHFSGIWYALWVVLFVVVSAASIRNFVTAQDPFFYIGLAKTLLREPPGCEMFWQAFFRVAPGYPLLLAAAIALLGDFGAYYVNPALAVFFSWTLFAILRFRAPSRDRTVMIASMLSLLPIFFGYGLNIHFLLYPFREVPAYAFAFAGYVLIENAAATTRARPRLLGAGVLLVLAAGIREPMLVCLVCAAARWFLVESPRRWQVGWLLLPLVVLLVVSAALYLLAEHGVSFQARYVWFALSNSAERAEVVSQYMARLAALSGFVIEAFTWPGIFFLLIGLHAHRKAPGTWLYFVIPSLCFVFFYACVEAHRRYALVAVAFLAPLAGEGFACLLRAVSARMKWDGSMSRRVLAAFTLLLAGGMIILAANQKSWGPSVSRSEVRRFQQALAAVVADEDAVYHEPACRYLRDALVTYTDVTLETPSAGMDRRLANRKRSCWYLRPTNKEAFYTRIIHQYPVSTEHLVRAQADLVPHMDAGGQPAVVEIAGGQFELQKIEPWSHREVSQSIHCRAGEPLTLWLDLETSDSAAGKTVRVRETGSGRIVQESRIESGNGFVAVFIPGAKIRSSSLIVEVRSDSVLPAEPVYGTGIGPEPVSFPLAHGRGRSVSRWIRPPFEVVRGEPKFLAVCRIGGTLCLPPVYGPASEAEVLLLLDPVAGEEKEVVLSYHFQNDVVGEDRSLFSDSPQWNSFRLSLCDRAGEELCVIMSAEPEGCHGGAARIRMVKIQIL